MSNLENKHDLSIVILDFNRKWEVENVINSIHKHVKFNYEIVLNCNGGDTSYGIEWFKSGLIDRLVLHKNGRGAGYGCLDAINNASNEFFFYNEGDQIFIRDFSLDELNYYKNLLKTEPNIKFINPVGSATQGEFTQRAFLGNTNVYKELSQSFEFGGPGSNRAGKKTVEQSVQEYLKANDFNAPIFDPLVFDYGCFSVNENSDGSVWLHKTSDKKLWLIKGPVKEKFVYPAFTEEEWAEVLNKQVWPDGKIPSNEVKHSFKYWNFDSIENEKVDQLRKFYGKN